MLERISTSIFKIKADVKVLTVIIIILPSENDRSGLKTPSEEQMHFKYTFFHTLKFLSKQKISLN